MNPPFHLRIYSIFTIFILFLSGLVWNITFWSEFGNQHMQEIFSENSVYDLFKFFTLNMFYYIIFFFLSMMLMASIFMKSIKKNNLNPLVFYETFKSESKFNKAKVGLFVIFLLLSYQNHILAIFLGVVFSATLYPVILNLNIFNLVKSRSLKFFIAYSLVIFPFYCYAMAYNYANMLFRNNSHIEHVYVDNHSQKFIGIVGKNQYLLSEDNKKLIVEDIFSKKIIEERPVIKKYWFDSFFNKKKESSH